MYTALDNKLRRIVISAAHSGTLAEFLRVPTPVVDYCIINIYMYNKQNTIGNFAAMSLAKCTFCGGTTVKYIFEHDNFKKDKDPLIT